MPARTEESNQLLCTTKIAAKNNISFIRYLFWYTVCFGCLFVASYWAFFLSKKSFVSDWDGISQPYTFFLYEGRWLREIVRQLARGGVEVPLWDLSIGFGADIPTSLMYIIGDPLNLVSVFTTEASAEVVFEILIVVRAWLCGVTFSLWTRTKRLDAFSVLLGSLVYAFCGYMVISFQQCYFVYPMILFPLLLMGVDRIFEKDSSILFIFSVALFWITYFYFAFMASLLLVLYCIVKYIQTTAYPSVRSFLKTFCKFLGYYLLGFAISCVLVLPILYTIASGTRLRLERNIGLLYPFGLYLRFLASLVGVGGLSADSYNGFGTTGLAAIAFLLSNSNNKKYKVALAILLAILLVPALGSMLNGFSYPSQRWSWALSLCVSIIVALMAQRLISPTMEESKKYALIAVIVVSILVISPNTRNTHELLSCVFILLLAIVLLVWAVNASAYSMKRRQLLLLLFLCVNLGVENSIVVSGFIPRQMNASDLYAAVVEDSPLRVFSEIEDSNLWRYDLAGTTRYLNSSMLNDVNGIDFFDSIYNNNQDTFNKQLGLIDAPWNNKMYGLDRRAYLETALGVKYFILPSGKAYLAPYGFRSKPIATVSVGSTKNEVLINDDLLPLVYTFDDTTISQSQFDALTIPQRQQALLQSLTLEDEYAEEADLDGLTFTDEEIDYRIGESDGHVSFDGSNSFTVDGANSTMSLSFQSAPNSETYLVFEDLHYSNPLPEFPETGGLGSKLRWIKDAIYYYPAEEAWLGVRTPEGATPSIPITTPTFHLYSGRHDWLINLGYSETSRTSAEIAFSKAGVYTFGSMRLVSQPMDSLEALVSKRLSNPTTLEESMNSYSATADMVQDGYLFFSIPWSSGWTAKVDGEEVTPLKANVAFMAFHLLEGHHEVELNYMTPMLREGFAVSALGLLGTALVCFWNRRRKSRKPS